MVVVLEGNGHFASAVGGESGRRTSVGRDDEYVHASLTGGGKGYLLAVGTPDRVGIVGSVGGQLASLATSGRYAIEVALVREDDGLAIGRDGLTNASSLTNGRFDLTLSDGEAAISFNANYDNNRLNFDLDNYTSNVVSSAPTGLRIYKLDTAAGIAGTQATPTEKGVREVYNLQGQRVNANGKLPKGIYIINGKKTVVR